VLDNDGQNLEFRPPPDEPGSKFLPGWLTLCGELDPVPDSEFADAWRGIKMDGAIKERLVAQGVFGM
jgi:hypothetical protein